MFRLLDGFVRQFIRKSLRRALVDGDFTWLAITAGLALLRVVFRDQKPKVVTEELRLGETIMVSHVPPVPTRRRGRTEEEQ